MAETSIRLSPLNIVPTLSPHLARVKIRFVVDNMSQKAANPSFDYMARLQIELQREFRKKAGIMEEMELNPEIWNKLPTELLLLVLANLPTLTTVKFRAVCKRWKCLLSDEHIYKQISSTVPLCSSPAFLFGGMPWVINKSVVDKDLYLLQLLPTSNTYKLSLDFLTSENLSSPDSVSVVTSCKSILCCCSSVYGTLISLYLCNPVTRTLKKLPNPSQLNRWYFIAMEFDISLRRCIIVKGTYQIVEEKNYMVMEMYDSNTNVWTQLNTINVLPVYPSGNGVYSRGKFYWINEMKVHEGFSTRFRYDVAVFNVAQSSWDVIRQPLRTDAPDSEFLCFWNLTGHDGNVVLVYSKDLCLWKLNEDEEVEESYRWSELQAFPRSIRDEAITCGNTANNLSGLRGLERKKIGYLEQKMPPQIIVNSCGFVLVHLHRNKLVVFDSQGSLIESIRGPPLWVFEQSEPRPYAYEINNVVWP